MTWWTLLFACTSGPGSESPRADSAFGTPDSGAGPVGDCPAFADGAVEVASAGQRRKLLVSLPAQTQGAPVLFFWHGRRQRAEDMVDRGELVRLAAEEGIIAIAPDSIDRNGEAWVDEPDSYDVQLFDDVTRCAISELGADPDQIHTTGFSAGGVFTTWLIMTRADVLASALTFSGGVDGTNLPYLTPATDLPVMVVWGGPGDTAEVRDFTVSFEDTSLYLADRLLEDGHFVVLCEHTNDHRIPNAAPLMLTEWSLVHRRGEPSPRRAGLGDLPDYCVVPSPSEG